MPALATLGLFAVSALALVAIPGPNHVYIVARSLEQGRAAGFASTFGVETATLLHVAAAAAGFSAVLASSATAFAFVKHAGVAYLLYLATRTLAARDAPAGPAAPAARASREFLAAIGLASDLLYALGADGAGARLRASTGFARRRRNVTGGLYLVVAVVALVGGRRPAT